ncbi:MAG: hypothetical protein KAW41_03475 [Candidatus Diapherotrites archaeon]|nr:hypothetical protein [Candidatus Diapherotrites archaeon]
MADMTLVAVALLQVAFQLLAAFFAWRILKFTGGMVSWGLIIVALLVQTVRRVTTLSILLGLLPGGGLISTVDELLLPLTISACLMLGMWSLLQLFTKKYGQGK